MSELIEKLKETDWYKDYNNRRFTPFSHEDLGIENDDDFTRFIIDCTVKMYNEEVVKLSVQHVLSEEEIAFELQDPLKNVAAPETKEVMGHYLSYLRWKYSRMKRVNAPGIVEVGIACVLAFESTGLDRFSYDRVRLSDFDHDKVKEMIRRKKLSVFQSVDDQ
ncbi:MAG: hypothetical protein Alpg2KO_25170 [Alphaproteobacteria bacterium]